MEPKKKEYDYDRILISLENCILPSERLDETPSMKDGLDRDTENDLRSFACEMIQIAGILLKIPQVAMATGQVLLQRFYFSKSMVKLDVEVSAMAAIFLAAKIEESPRRIRDVINVCHHIKQRMLQKSHTPMDFTSMTYFNLKNGIIKAERRILKDLGFCVHVKHPHKLIITYLQMIGHEKNQNLARRAWNYMNDSLRSDVFVRFPPESIACACIFLAARNEQVPLPQRPAWFQIFDATYNEIEDISISIMRLYSKPKRKLAHLESLVSKLRKEKAEKEKTFSALKDEKKPGSFTPSQADDNNTSATQPPSLNNNQRLKNGSKPSSRTTSPTENRAESRTSNNSSALKNGNDSSDNKKPRRPRPRDASESSQSSAHSDSADETNKRNSNKKQRKDESRSRKRRSPSSDSDYDRRPKNRRSSHSPDDRRSKLKPKDTNRDRVRDTNGYSDKDKKHRGTKKRSRSRSPVRYRSLSPQSRKTDKSRRDREREKERSKDKYRGRR
uniref:Cyclin-like domain-containing protein n=2 Tax=Clytia hemisphaerica TaxID=252671 RepID=A0A7M5V6X3_9CNID